MTDANKVGSYKPTRKKYTLLIGYRKDGSSDPQSFHYPSATWTPAEARAHCTAHKGILFEPAVEKPENSPKVSLD